MKRRYVAVRLLEKGMIIDQSIVDKTGRILIARKTSLDSFHIEALAKMKISGVYIREGREEPAEQAEAPVFVPQYVEKTIQKQTVPDPPVITLSENVRNRIFKNTQHLFSRFSQEDFSETVNAISEDLLNSITKNNAVALDISSLKKNDEYTFQHSVDVAFISMIIAQKSGFSKEEIRMVGSAGLLHDIGKQKIPQEILNKPDKLTDEEFSIMRQHPVLGYEMIKDTADLDPEIKMGVLQHHEKINGAGYPQGLSDEQITPFAKIISIADIYDALVTDRPYKKALSQRDAVEMIMAMTNDLDTGLMRSFLDSVVLYPIGSTVRLSNGKFARVVQNNCHYPLRPRVVELKTGEVYDLCDDISCANIIIE